MARELHPWNVTPAEARLIQEQLRSRVRAKDAAVLKRLRHVGGVDISVKGGWANAALVVLTYPELELVDMATHLEPVPFPYVPGLLSFRECPSILRAFEELHTRPDVLMVDGQGVAHPRRIGLASHLGVLMGIPTIGCAKTRFIGTHEEPADEAGCYTNLWDEGELIGAVLRTRSYVKPLYVSVGHKIELPTALDLVLECCRGFRLPETTRLAHQLAGGSLRGSWERD